MLDVKDQHDSAQASRANEVQFALASVRKWYFDTFTAREDPTSFVDYANGACVPSDVVYLPDAMEDGDEDRQVEHGVTYAFAFKAFQQSAARNSDLCHASKLLKLAPEQAEDVPEVHQRVRFFMNLKKALATTPGPEHPSSALDLGERCELKLEGYGALPHISPPEFRETAHDKYDKLWYGAEAELRMFVCWTSPIVQVFPHKVIGLSAECRVCGEMVELAKDLHALGLEKCGRPPYDPPQELVDVLVEAQCTVCGYTFSALHPRVEIAFEGIALRDD